MIRIVTITEGNVDALDLDYTQAEAVVWCEGFASGGGAYGAGDCFAVTKETLDEHLDPNDRWTDKELRIEVLKLLK